MTSLLRTRLEREILAQINASEGAIAYKHKKRPVVMTIAYIP